MDHFPVSLLGDLESHGSSQDGLSGVPVQEFARLDGAVNLSVNPMGTGGGLFRPRVIKMLAISKPMIQLP